MDHETAKAIKAVSDKVNAMQAQLDALTRGMHNKSKADIDYLAMMSDIDLTEGNEEEGEKNE